MTALSKPNFDERVSTGLSGLDEITGGGLPRNRVYLLHGNPGTGKTTLAIQFLLEGVRHGEPVLYVTLSETKAELLDVARSHGVSLDGIEIYDLAISGESIEDSSYTLFHPSEVELGRTTKEILDVVTRVKPARIVFDSLSEFRLLSRDPLRYRRQILGLKQFFVARDCTTLLLDDNTSEDDRQLESIVHGVIALEQNVPVYGPPRRNLRVLKLRGVAYRGGSHDFVIATGGLRIFPRLGGSSGHDRGKEELISSGLPGLDELIGGGFDAGTAVLIMGPPGTGKSTIALQFADSAASHGRRVAYFTFEEGATTLHRRAAALGMKFDEHVKAGQCSVRQVNPAELSPGEFSMIVRKSVEEEGAKLIIIDSLNGYQQAMLGEDFLPLHMHTLLDYLRSRGVLTMMVLAQSGLFGSNMAATVDVSYLADSVLLVRHFESEGRVRKAISVLKRRSGGHEDTIRQFTISSEGIKVGAPLEAFKGVLTGVPEYVGSKHSIMRQPDDQQKQQ